MLLLNLHGVSPRFEARSLGPHAGVLRRARLVAGLVAALVALGATGTFAVQYPDTARVWLKGWAVETLLPRAD